jgi:pimeloyl-ACP methyl ester carboxylesterase
MHTGTRLGITLIAVVGVCSACSDLSASSADPPVDFGASHRPLTPCELPGIEETLFCGELRVPENPSLPTGRSIPLFVVVLPALSATPRADAWVELTGGPGNAATDYARAYTRELLEYRRDRDVLLVDQRGMGRSNPLYCESLDLHRVSSLFDRWPVEAVAQCRDELATRADLSQYSTAHAAEDLEAVRRWLGYERLNLFAYSYGTRVARTYLQSHPERVRSAILWGVVPADFRRPLHYPRDGQQAMDRLLDDCLADPDCSNSFPRVRAELGAVRRRLDAEPVAVSITHPVTRVRIPATITSGGFADGLWIALMYPDRARRLPMVIHHAASGDFGPFLALDVATVPPRRRYYNGAHLSVVCPEETQHLRDDEVAGISPEWFMPADRLRQYQSACARWGLATLPIDREKPLSVAVPTLIVSGYMDPVTPPSWGDQAARTIEPSRHIVVRHLSHEANGLSEAACLDRIFIAFLRDPEPKELDIECTDAMLPPPFALEPVAEP